MTFLEHLEELRWRLVRSSIAIFVFAIIAFLGKSIIFDKILFAPRSADFLTYRLFCDLSHLLTLGDKLCMGDVNITLQNIDMSGQFSMHIMVSMVAGLIMAFPFVIYQFWSFLKPGLKQKEIKSATGIVFYSSILFFIGVLFGYFIIGPLSLQFLGSYRVSESVESAIKLNSYISTLVSITLTTGLVFELPIFIYFFTKIGLVTPEFLKKYRKHALVVVLILSAVITPPDITSQVLVALPIMLLYELSIGISRRVIKQQEKEERENS
ncbi:MAG: twin-arginine translocase subunit TatC [Bacteroidetes bacterium]|nr:MAG: twin-arginine translocase subunit TatC [Bacteroidota bacterium]